MNAVGLSSKKRDCISVSEYPLVKMMGKSARSRLISYSVCSPSISGMIKSRITQSNSVGRAANISTACRPCWAGITGESLLFRHQRKRTADGLIIIDNHHGSRTLIVEDVPRIECLFRLGTQTYDRFCGRIGEDEHANRCAFVGLALDE